MPFRRLVQAVDEWARANPSVEVMAQVGVDPSFRPAALTAFASVTPAKYAELVQSCELVVAHAGMGSVLTALEHGKPMILMPRRGHLQETRNDHQSATLRWLGRKPGIYAAQDEAELKAALDDWRLRGVTPPPNSADHRTDSLDSLVSTLRAFIG